MIHTGALCKFALARTQSLSEHIRKLHTFGNLNQRQLTYLQNEKVESSLWFTTLPTRRKRALSLMDKKKAKMKTGPIPSGPLVIKCKNEKLNHYRGMQYGKFDVVPLASRAWNHKKSKGDYFTILPITEHPAFLTGSTDSLPQNFKDLGILDEIIKLLNDMDIDHPTTVQAKAMKVLLRGSNVLMTAETGCGKTLAYLVPIIQQIMMWKTIIPNIPIQHNAPMGIILLPTRELAMQTGIVAQKLCPELGIKCLTLLGGKAQKMVLHPVLEPVDLLVATVGVMCKLLQYEIYSLNLCKHVVVDEADTLLDDSFSHSLKYLLHKTKLKFVGAGRDWKERHAQLCFSSATMPTSIESILEGVVSLTQLERVSTKYLHKIQPHVLQKFHRVSKLDKKETLLKIVKKNAADKVPTMIFCNKTDTCDWLNLFLNENGVKSIRINSGMFAEERLKQYQDFRNGFFNVICCTDIASRGLDSTRVKHVINYDFPRFMADYVHRCGRTGRIGHKEDCLVTSLICHAGELKLVNEIEKAARTESTLKYVNNNIARILHYKSQSDPA